MVNQVSYYENGSEILLIEDQNWFLDKLSDNDIEPDLKTQNYD